MKEIIFKILAGLLFCMIISIVVFFSTLIFMRFNYIFMTIFAILIVYNLGDSILYLFKKN